MSKKYWIGIAVLVVIVGGFLFIRSQQSQNQPIKIGALFPLTGGLASYGEPAQKMAVIAADKINQAGGINGRKLELDVQDHACDPKIALSTFQQLSTVKGIRIFTSVACSGTILSIAPVLEQNHAMLLGTIVTAAKISGVSPYVFRNWAQDSDEAKLMSEEMLKEGSKKVGVLYEETDYAKGFEASFEKFLVGSTIQVVHESFVSGATDMRTQLTKLKSENLDALLVVPQTVTSGDVILKQMSELKFQPRLFVTDNILKSKDLLTKYRSVLEGALSGDYVMDQAPGLNAVLTTYKTKYGKDCAPSNICAGVYDAVHLLAKAIGEKGYDAVAVSDYLKTNSYSGVSGTISFDQKNDRANTHYTLFVIKNGIAEILK
ncbi:ABC transporter substrate-binding protein [Candidatus Uhrbacteria bacterium]|nr:ABC transporter substrate-binding protein [Candidatus Uhrbacteria bacterium]